MGDATRPRHAEGCPRADLGWSAMSSPNASSPAPTTSTPKGSDSFVHLHVHTEYSMLDGAARVGDLFAETSRMEMPALAMTDHGNVFGAYDFWKRGRDAGVKAIIGQESYLTPGTHRTDKTRVRWADGGEDDVSGGGAYTFFFNDAATTE